jgi:penicillin-binding protein 1A
MSPPAPVPTPRTRRPLWRRLWSGVRAHPLLILSMLPLAAVALALAYVLALVPLTPSVADLRKVRSQQPTIVMSSDGQQLAVFRRANREWVPLHDISPNVVKALLATEDQRFYEHHGLDIRRTVGAALNSARGRLQGGSTITQQLARNLFPEEIGRAPTIERKIKEAITAVRIEQAYGKDEILETYLNTVPFLYNAYGIEMAARTYFDRSARDLDVLQSATLVGMLKGTSYYNPVLNPQRARQRRNTVLAQMARAGALDPQQLASLRGAPLHIDFTQQQEEPGPAPHFVVQVRRWLIDWADRNGYDIYADGLVVRTTLDTRAQALATRAVAEHAARLQKTVDALWTGKRGWSAQRDLVNGFIRETAQFQAARSSGLGEAEALAKLRADSAFMEALRVAKTRLQAGFIAMEPGTGLVRAWVGSRDFDQDQFDHVAQARRQPGSTFKPFVYGAAFQQGARPTEMLVDAAVDIPVGPGEVWRPTDVDPATNQPMTLRDALAFSKNRITAQLTQRTGPENIATLAKAMGVRDSRLDPVMSLGLGTSPVTLREMVTAYATIANAGRYVPPLLVSRVEDRNGKVLQSFPIPVAQEALPFAPDVVLLDAMRGVIDRGTGTAIRTRYGLQGDLAGKTGTTQDNTDGWFILMHPQLVAGSWVGFNDSRLSMQDPWGQGARSALPMVGEFFKQTLRARLIDAKAVFPRLTDPDVVQQIDAWWGPMPAAEPAPVVLPEVASIPEVAAPPAGSQAVPGVVITNQEGWGGGPFGGGPVPRAVVVAPPRDAGPIRVPPAVATRPVERAIVAGSPQPARIGPSGEPNGAAAAAPRAPAVNPYRSQEAGF